MPVLERLGMAGKSRLRPTQSPAVRRIRSRAERYRHAAPRLKALSSGETGRYLCVLALSLAGWLQRAAPATKAATT
jgi:hypothetical protein